MTCIECHQDAVPLPDRGSIAECSHCGARYVGVDYGFYSYSAWVFSPDPEATEVKSGLWVSNRPSASIFANKKTRG